MPSGSTPHGRTPPAPAAVAGLRIREMRLSRGLTMAELAARIGVSQPAISQWESGREKPGRDSLQKLASAFDVSLDELCGAPTASPSLRQEPVTSVNAMSVDVPVFGTAVGGEQGDFSFNGEVTDYVRRPQGVARLRSLYALWVTGDSMAPWNCSGDLIYVTPARPPAPGDHVVVELVGAAAHEPGTAMVKLLTARTATHLKLKQYNPEREFSLPLSRVKCVHKVLSLRELLGV